MGRTASFPSCISVQESIKRGGRFNSLFNQTLAYGVDEIRICRLLAASAHLGGDLSAMIRRVQQNMGQNVLHGAIPRLALAVLVRDILSKMRGRKLAEISAP